jgi:predicted nucleic acid-binding protein
MRALVLDAEAVSRLARRPKSANQVKVVHSAPETAQELGSPIYIPAAVLAELYRGGSFNQQIDSFLARFPAVEVVVTDRILAKTIGGVLAKAGRGSADHVDASVVAVAINEGGGVILTADVSDFSALTAGMVAIKVRSVD